MKYVKLLSALFIYSTTVNAQEKIKILTLDPGHFHAALIYLLIKFSDRLGKNDVLLTV